MAFAFKSLLAKTRYHVNRFNGNYYHQIYPRSTAIIVGTDYREYEETKQLKFHYTPLLKHKFAGQIGDSMEVNQDNWVGEWCSKQILHATKPYFGDGNIILINEEDNNKLKPYKNIILKELEGAVKAAEAGDTIFFYYFGHGSRGQLHTMSARRNGKYDVTREGDLLRALHGIHNKVNVTMALNCCFSSSIGYGLRQHATCYTSTNGPIPSSWQYTALFAGAMRKANKDGNLDNRWTNGKVQERLERFANDYVQNGIIGRVPKKYHEFNEEPVVVPAMYGGQGHEHAKFLGGVHPWKLSDREVRMLHN